MHHTSSRLGVIAFTLCGFLTLLRAETSKTGAPPVDWNGLKAEATTLGQPEKQGLVAIVILASTLDLI